MRHLGSDKGKDEDKRTEEEETEEAEEKEEMNVSDSRRGIAGMCSLH